MMLLVLMFLVTAVAQNINLNLDEINLQIDFMNLKLNNCSGYVDKIDIIHVIGRRDTPYNYYELNEAIETLKYLKRRYIQHCAVYNALKEKVHPKILMENIHVKIRYVENLLRQRHCGYHLDKFQNVPRALKREVTPVYWKLELELAQQTLNHFKTKYKDCIEDPCSSQPCKNDGTCVATEGGYNCTCRSQYFGRNCQKQGCGVLSIGSSQLVTKANTNYATWMKDPALPTSHTVYTTHGWAVNRLSEYSNIAALKSNTVKKVYSLPVTLRGTDQVVYNGSLYGYISVSNVLLQYDLESGATQRLTLTGAGHDQQCHYDWGGNSDIDFASDEYGLWVIYGAVADRCRMQLARIEPLTFTIERTWTMAWSKKGLGNAFMVCGKLYVLKSGNPSIKQNYIIHTFDTNTNQSETLGSNRMPFTVSGQYLVSMSYNKNDKMLYTWENGQLYRYPVTLNSTADHYMYLG